MDLCRFDIIALDDVENRNVTRGWTACIGRNHDVIGLGETAHDVEDGCFSDRC